MYVLLLTVALLNKRTKNLVSETLLTFHRMFITDSENLSGVLVAHTDAVWDLAVQTGSLQLLSASADGTCRLWSPTLKSPLLNSYIPEQGKSSISIHKLYLNPMRVPVDITTTRNCCLVALVLIF